MFASLREQFVSTASLKSHRLRSASLKSTPVISIFRNEKLGSSARTNSASSNTVSRAETSLKLAPVILHRSNLTPDRRAPRKLAFPKSPPVTYVSVITAPAKEMAGARQSANTTSSNRAPVRRERDRLHFSNRQLVMSRRLISRDSKLQDRKTTTAEELQIRSSSARVGEMLSIVFSVDMSESYIHQQDTPVRIQDGTTPTWKAVIAKMICTPLERASSSRYFTKQPPIFFPRCPCSTNKVSIRTEFVS